tara:strand:- start:1485 stop:1760 length:276 start_codon:yes stop_codon:yes gene_type:complete
MKVSILENGHLCFEAETPLENVDLAVLGGRINNGSLSIGVYDDTSNVGAISVALSSEGIVSELVRGCGQFYKLGQQGALGEDQEDTENANG